MGRDSRGMSVLRRVTGMGGAGSLALALLAGGCVLAATVGPRQAQATAEQALQQTMNNVGTTDRDIVVSSSWSALKDTIQAAPYSDALTEADFEEVVTTQLRGDFGTGPLRLTPPSTDWMGMSPSLSYVIPSLPSLKGIPGKLEVAYRYPLGGNLRLVSGSMPDTALAPTLTKTTETFHLQVVVTPQTARQFGLRPGSQLPVGAPESIVTAAKLAVVDLDVTGIVEPADARSSFWAADPLLPAPTLDRVGGSESWDGGVIADPGEFYTILQIFGDAGLRVQWDFATSTTGQHGQPQAVYDQANQIASQTPQLTGPVALLSKDLTVSYGLVQPLAAFIQALNDVNVVLWLVYVGLAVAGVVTLLLAALMIAARRSAELAVRRARGASLWQLFWLGAGGAAVACVPAGALAWAAAVLLVPGSAPPGPAAWWPSVASLAFAALGPGAAAAWQHRLPRRRAAARRRWRWLPRLVLEVTACAAAIGAIIVFRAQSGAAGLYASAAPVLVAVPAVIAALRLYQLLLRALARAAARQRGLTGFLGLRRAAQAPVTLALPAMTLVLALTVAAFTGMVRDAVVRGETAASWQATGADVVITAPGQLAISPQAVRAITAVPGVRHAAAAYLAPLVVALGAPDVTAVIVDPASYAALAASAEGFPPVRPALLAKPLGQGEIPVLASPQAAAYLGGRRGAAIIAQDGLPALRVRVSGELQSTPALPGGGPFIVVPMAAIPGVSPPPNLLLLNGPSIGITRLRAAVRAAMPGAEAPAITTRSAALQQLAGAPLQQGAFLLFTLAIAYAAALALAVMLLQLALGAADREATTARLATMGLAEGQRVRLVALEVIPSIIASAAAAIACATALPALLAPQVNLTVFTQTQTPVPLRPDLASFTLPLAALLVITIIALAYEVRSGRGRGIAVTMRT